MKRFHTGLAAALVLLLGGCSSSDDTPLVSISELGAGVYTVSTGDAESPVTGRYYAGADGRRLLVLSGSDDVATRHYRRTDALSAWVALPAPSADVSVTLLRSDAVSSATVPVASMAGSYVLQVASGVVASFKVSAEGQIVAGSSGCKLTGKLGASSLPNTLAFTLSASDCGTLPATSTGVLAVDTDYAPAAFRLMGDDGKTTVLDLWAYRE